METSNEQLPLLFILDSNSFNYSEKEEVVKFLNDFQKMIENDKFIKRICKLVELWAENIDKTASNI